MFTIPLKLMHRLRLRKELNCNPFQYKFVLFFIRVSVCLLFHISAYSKLMFVIFTITQRLWQL